MLNEYVGESVKVAANIAVLLLLILCCVVLVVVIVSVSQAFVYAVFKVLVTDARERFRKAAAFDRAAQQAILCPGDERPIGKVVIDEIQKMRKGK